MVYLSVEYKPDTYVLGNHERDIYAAEIAALFHDIIDSKYCMYKENMLAKIYSFIIDELQLQQDFYKAVENIIIHMSFSKEFENSSTWIENIKTFDNTRIRSENIYQLFRLVSDADKLDSIGCIGIARTFKYGTESIEKSMAYCLKLFNILDMLYYKQSKQVGHKRIKDMIYFLKQLNNDLNCKDFVDLKDEMDSSMT